jgi:pyridoxal/pyridoxine/pyridoxamine kinase
MARRAQAAAVLVVHSLPAWGSVGLPQVMAVLGSACCAVPSVLLNAPGSHPLARRWPQPLIEMLDASLAVQQARGLRPDLFVGYLNDAAQADALAGWLAVHRAELGTVYVDPICGDHGRAYVEPALIGAWPAILEQADVAFPNLTEFALIAAAAGPAGEAAQAYWQRPGMPRVVVVTSSLQGKDHGVRLQVAGDSHWLSGHRHAHEFGGSGDLFAGCCIQARRHGYAWPDAVRWAMRRVEAAVLAAAATVVTVADTATSRQTLDLPDIVPATSTIPLPLPMP